MSNAKSYIIENHNHSSHNHAGCPVIFPGEPNLSALSIDGGVTPVSEGLGEKLAKLLERARAGFPKRKIGFSFAAGLKLGA